MYCSTCGNPVNENLNYCNVCGAKIGKNALQIHGSSSPILLIAAGFFGIVGLFGFIRLLRVLIDSRLDQPVILTILIAYLVTLLLLCSVLVGHVWKHSGKVRTDLNQEPEDYAPPKQFRGRHTNQLEEPREPFIGSVTENTTRTFDKVPLKD
jgi:hypothetical protein